MQSNQTQRAGRVFLAEQNPRYGLSNAGTFGQLNVINDGEPFNPMNLTEAARFMHAELLHAQYDPSIDFIILTGNPPVVATFLSVATMFGPVVKMLLFDARSSCYRERGFERPSMAMRA